MKPYTVSPGDTLSLIASEFNLTLADLMKVNPQILNADMIDVGQQIYIPEQTSVVPHLKESTAVESGRTAASVDRLLARAKSVINKKIKYELGAGGMVPSLSTPAGLNNACDCSGFACWCLGISRKTDHPLYLKYNGGWINTDAIVHDAKKATGFFTTINTPRVGCFAVYPGRPLRKIGHIGLVSEVKNGKATKVIHCSSGNYRLFKAAIMETPLTVFQKPDVLYVWYEGVDF